LTATCSKPSIQSAVDASAGRLLVNNAGYGDVNWSRIRARDFRAQIETTYIGVSSVTKAPIPLSQ